MMSHGWTQPTVTGVLGEEGWHPDQHRGRSREQQLGAKRPSISPGERPQKEATDTLT